VKFYIIIGTDQACDFNNWHMFYAVTTIADEQPKQIIDWF